MHVCAVRDSVENVIRIRVKMVINAAADTAKMKIRNRFALAASTQAIAPHMFI